MENKIEIRACHSLEELEACVRLQREVWGFADADLVPLRLFVLADKIGGQVFGAFAGQTLAGYVMSLPGIRGGCTYLHSHMLAVRADCRNAGLGRRLKLVQRQEAMARGIELIEWTFDPLEIKNSFLNLERLGAVARRYTANQYGSTSSPLQGGLPSDRLVAEWWLKSKRVQTVVDRGGRPQFKTEQKISVPAQIYQWKAGGETRARAAEVQARNRELFQQAFSQGLTVLGYQRDEQGNGTFLLGPWDEAWACG